MRAPVSHRGLRERVTDVLPVEAARSPTPCRVVLAQETVAHVPATFTPDVLTNGRSLQTIAWATRLRLQRVGCANSVARPRCVVLAGRPSVRTLRAGHVGRDKLQGARSGAVSTSSIQRSFFGWRRLVPALATACKATVWVSKLSSRRERPALRAERRF
jgi:hypothetical protein